MLRKQQAMPAASDTAFDIGPMHWELIYYMGKHGKVKAQELAKLVGITTPSVRVRLLQLMAMGIVLREKTRDRQVWFYLKEEK